jgi:hypothetical protein
MTWYGVGAPESLARIYHKRPGREENSVRVTIGFGKIIRKIVDINDFYITEVILR